MKRIATAALAAVVTIAPFGATAASAQQWRDHDRYERRDERHDRRDDRRDDRRETRWDRRSYNGYYLNGRFNYGPPPAWAYQRHDYRPGYVQWRRGDRLPDYYRSSYREVDWRREHYRAPPRGYPYVRDDRGEVLLVGIATGVILGLILSN